MSIDQQGIGPAGTKGEAPWETTMKQYTVCAAFYDRDNRATVTILADNFGHACEQAIAMLDDGKISATARSWEPGASFVHGIIEGKGDEADCFGRGVDNVPPSYREGAVIGNDSGMLLLIQDLWSHIENVVDYAPDRSRRFLTLRDRVRGLLPEAP